jgi:isoamylase
MRISARTPVLNTVKLITEPWDCGPGGYQVGEFPPGWAEWNDKFRDNGAISGKVMWGRLLVASPHLFDRLGRRPSASINFITAHDGFTLNDILTYNDKHNEANGEGNRDGSSDNRDLCYRPWIRRKCRQARLGGGLDFTYWSRWKSAGVRFQGTGATSR